MGNDANVADTICPSVMGQLSFVKGPDDGKTRAVRTNLSLAGQTR